MDKTNIRKILTSVLAVLLIFSMFTETAFALSGDGSHISHTGGGSSVSGAYLLPSSNADHHVGFRFTWLTLGSDGYYSRKASLDVFYKGYNPISSWGYHIKATVNGTTYRNLSKYEYKRYYDSLTIDREYYSTSTAYKYCNRTDIPVTLPADEDAMTTWGKKEANMNIILNKMVSGSTVANMKSSDFVFIEPIYRVKIENTNYCITVTEMGLIGCVVCSKTSTGNEGSGYGSGWVTIRRYTNLNWPDALKTDSAHAGISAGTTLSSATSFQNLVNKGYGLMVVWNTNPHLLTVYYTTGTGDSSLKINSSYKLASDFTSYSSSYIRNSSNNYFTQSVYYDNNLTLMNGAGSGFKMTRDYYTFSKWQKNGTSSYFDGGSTHKASALNSAVATGNTDVTFTAVWTPKPYKITYNLNGGKIGSSTANPVQNYNYETDVYIGNYSSGATAYATPSKDGYNFGGWKYTGSTVGYWTKDNVYANKYHKGQWEHGDITLYAQWSKKTYTVTYNANGGSGAPSAQTKTHGVDLTLSSTKPTRDGYNFVSWNTKSDGKGTTYQPSAKYTTNANLTLYAQWTKKTYTVTYNANGGSGAPASQTKTHGVDLTLASGTPTRTGYDFVSWNTKADGKGTTYKPGAKYTANADLTLYAQWQLNTYTVSYNANGGKGAPSDQTKKHGTDLTLSTTKPTRDGYTFSTWNTKADGKGTSYASGGKYTGNADLLLYAIWNPIQYTVKFIGNGATGGTMSSQSFTYNVEQALTANAYKRIFNVTYNYGNGTANSSEKANAVFSGWAKTSTGVKEYNNQQKVKNLSAKSGDVVNLYALWNDAALTLPSPTKTGYRLTGWFTSSSGGTKVGDGGGKYTPAKDVTLYAQWTPVTYVVRFNGNGATSGTMADQSFTYDKSQNLTANAYKRTFTVTFAYGNGATNTTAKATSAFGGWAKTATGAKAYGDQQSVKNLTAIHGDVINLYARWSDASVPLPNPTRTGYTFTGWYTDTTGGTKIGNGGGSFTPSGNITVYGRWTPISYTVVFNGNGSTGGSTASMSVKYDETKALTANGFTRTGYQFASWNTKADGSGVKYTDKQQIKNLTAVAGAKVTLYAQWTPISYTVVFNGNGSTGGATASMTVKYDEAKALTANGFTRTGYQFVSWNTKADGTGTPYADKQTIRNLSAVNGSKITLYAVWQPAYSLSLEMIQPNAAYREGTEVVSSFYLVNQGGSGVTPAEDISVIFKVYRGSTVIKTVTLPKVVVPANEKNLLYFKWSVPSSLGSDKLYVSAEISEAGESYGLIKNMYASCKYEVSATPDTQFEISAPEGYTVPAAPSSGNTAKKWTEWVYENGAFKQVTYGIGISDAAVSVVPDASANAEKKNGVWTMKSGYSVSLSVDNGTKTVGGCSAPASSSYTKAQYAAALFPEFGYQKSADNYRTLELVSGKWVFRQNADYGRLHFTPLWFPDGPYTAAVVISDLWTPAGMLTRTANANTITIDGSAYDDWSIG